MNLHALKSVTFLAPRRNLPPTWVIHMATCRLVHNTPIHMDFLYGSLKRHQVHVDRRVVGWSAGRHVDHPCGGPISPSPAGKVIDVYKPLEVLFTSRSSHKNHLTLT